MNYLIVGSGVAALSGAAAIRKIDKAGPITLLTAETDPFYYKPRLPEILCNGVSAEQITVYKEKWYRANAIEVTYGDPVTSFDPKKKSVLTASQKTYPFDKLLLACGASASRLTIPGNSLKNVFTLRTLQDARAIAAAAMAGGQITIIGGGILALEAGYNLSKIGCKITVVEILSRLLPRQLDVPGAALLQRYLEEKGFTFFIGTQTARINGSGAVKSVSLKSGETIESATVLISAGIIPNVTLAQKAQLLVQRRICVNAAMQTSAPDVFAAGDCVEINGKTEELWQPALKQGAVAGANMAGGNQTYLSAEVHAASTTVADMQLVSAGNIDADNKSTVFVHETKTSYRKLVFTNGKAAGLILLGDIANSAELLACINKGVPGAVLSGDVIDPAYGEWNVLNA
ncbi:MAG: FAD-dependent oxidoreductase [Chitinivibrionales bacterium]|nr:FAD-dependent oxidoreductase [Chitinivibrionales bacterium]